MRASEIQFLDHLAPIWRALTSDERGVFALPKNLWAYARTLSVEPTHLEPHGLWLVASWGDLKRARMRGPVVLMEHGAGQTYIGQQSGSYLGAADRDRVIAVLVPGPLALAHHQATSDIPAYAIGSPKLDTYHLNPTPPTPRTVAITHHWDCHVVPETRSAYQHHYGAYRKLATKVHLVGHAHPRASHHFKRHCDRDNIPYAEHLDSVFAVASVLVADNTSALYEFASLGRPVVVLNAPWYRRDVEHGLRFWSHVPGVQVDGPGDLRDVVLRTLDEPVLFDRIHDVYAVTNGTATARAVAAIREVAG